ncbi:MAG: hypothetical protein H5T42_03355 [Methanothrix sp.]|uniref:Uncharacterized protein n=1 Tax=Methanothrix thermoacetophila (strain DSM 6194 / JCM 14653 / NBRC 101360 / PT) TaxID=349307 RepID=A0B734_METTP|nr:MULTISPECIES: hypothetical protein [Methanothrix]ABK14508.1 hypothetical protein Mthe_0718 [Methanothrix thermoacetophila PT]MBC7079494.1 hypothetical protein [Methanothrix sp.]NPU87466.1 hypothetical protein [Methanothrix sp.]
MRLISDMGLECTASSSRISDHIERIGALLKAARSDLRGHLALQPLLYGDKSVYSTSMDMKDLIRHVKPLLHELHQGDRL